MYSPDQIKHIHLEPTQRCQAQCPMCDRTNNPHVGKAELSLGNFMQIVDIDFARQLNSLLMCGNHGDPIVSDDILSIFRYLRVNNPKMYLHMTTNAGARDDEWWKELVSILGTRGKVTFSVDGLEDTNHLYRVGANWNKIIENAKAFIKAGGQACWQFIEFDHNKHQVEEARQLAHEMGFCEFRTVSSSRPDTTEIKPVRRSGKVSKIQCAKKQITKIQCENQGPYGNRILVNALGQVAPCCFLNGFFHFPFAHSKAEYDHSRNRLPFSFKEPRMTKLYNTHKDTTTDGPAGGLSAISLHCHTLKVILAGKFFADLQASWTTKTPIERCLEVCGKKKIKDEIYPFYFNK